MPGVLQWGGYNGHLSFIFIYLILHNNLPIDCKILVYVINWHGFLSNIS